MSMTGALVLGQKFIPIVMETNSRLMNTASPAILCLESSVRVHSLCLQAVQARQIRSNDY